MCFSMVAGHKDREKEVVHVTSILKACGYLRWSIATVKNLVVNKRKRWKAQENLKTNKDKSVWLFHMSNAY